MKSILSAAALLVAIATPALAGEAVTAQPQPQTAQVIVPAATEPSMSVAHPVTETGSQSKATAKSGGCGAKNMVYLTN